MLVVLIVVGLLIEGRTHCRSGNVALIHLWYDNFLCLKRT